jgi:hypothetical protein
VARKKIGRVFGIMLITTMGLTNEKVLLGMCKYNGYILKNYKTKTNWYIIEDAMYWLEKPESYVIYLTDDCKIITSNKEVEISLNKTLQCYVDEHLGELVNA